ncbi:MAG TPA: DUF2946 domain-containing protein [Methylophilaceae bacterium]|nr:DUF2946 domain-containing protein [Methylophilaceae bacterium]
MFRRNHLGRNHLGRNHLGFHHARLVSWIAIAAILFSALAPSISHAFAIKNVPQTLWQELCTAQGTKLIKPTAADGQQQAPVQNQLGIHFEHCPYCFSHAGSVGVMPATAWLFSLIKTGGQSAALYAVPAVAFHYPSDHPSRAPPTPT